MYTLPHPLSLRNAVDADDAFAQTLFASTRDDLRALALPPPMLDDLIAMQRRAQELGWRQEYPDAEVLVLEYAGEPAGRIVLARGAAWRVVDLALLPARRGLGLGRAVLGALQAAAASRGAAIGLSVLRTNDPALSLYRSTGFEVVGSDSLRHEMRWRPA